MSDSSEKADARWSAFRAQCHRIIFHSTRWDEKLFDVVLIVAILVSVGTVMLESVRGIRQHYGEALYAAEWVFTVLFTIEYALRIYVSPRPRQYIFSFYGVVDLLSILPTYLDAMYPGAHYLMLFRSLRVLRIFRVLKMAHFVGEANMLYQAVRASGRKIIVFFSSVLILVTILGSMMYLIEGPEHGFTSIPKSVYWAIVTLTTVGYGDISPQTPLGQLFASAIMITGFAIIAVPTGIVTAEIAMAARQGRSRSTCASCGADEHLPNARFCGRCGVALK